MAGVFYKVHDIDHGWKELGKLLKALKHGDTYVKAGVIGEKAQQKHVNSDLSIVDLAMVHEYGGGPGGRIPERSFIRATYDKNRERYYSALRVLLRAFYEGKAKLASILDVVGSNMGHDMRKAIRDGIPPPLKPGTIARKTAKGRKDPATPLLDTRQLVNTISHEVHVSEDAAGSGKAA